MLAIVSMISLFCCLWLCVYFTVRSIPTFCSRIEFYRTEQVAHWLWFESRQCLHAVLASRQNTCTFVVIGKLNMNYGFRIQSVWENRLQLLWFWQTCSWICHNMHCCYFIVVSLKYLKGNIYVWRLYRCLSRSTSISDRISIEALPYAKGCLLFVGWALRLFKRVSREFPISPALRFW